MTTKQFYLTFFYISLLAIKWQYIYKFRISLMFINTLAFHDLFRRHPLVQVMPPSTWWTANVLMGWYRNQYTVSVTFYRFKSFIIALHCYSLIFRMNDLKILIAFSVCEIRQNDAIQKLSLLALFHFFNRKIG